MPQFEPNIPYPLGHHLPGFLSPGGVAAPPVGIDLLVFICQCRLKGAAMQVQLDDIGSSEPLLRQVGEEEFVDDACTRDTHAALLLGSLMRGYDHAAEYSLGSHRDLWTVVEAAHRLAFRPLLKLIGWQVQTRLNERMVEHTVVFAAGHKREACHIGEHRPRPILTVESEQGMRLWKLVRCEIAHDRREALAQFHAILPVAAIAKTAEPVVAVGLTDHSAGPYHLPTLASGVARGANLIQPARGRRKFFGL